MACLTNWKCVAEPKRPAAARVVCTRRTTISSFESEMIARAIARRTFQPNAKKDRENVQS
jgi:hypothetical protein